MIGMGATIDHHLSDGLNQVHSSVDTGLVQNFNQVQPALLFELTDVVIWDGFGVDDVRSLFELFLI